MKKYLFHSTILTMAVLMLAACSDDDWKDEVDALKEPMPTGVVIMDAAAVTAVKGTEFKLRFRVNPTGVEITADNLELDLQNSDTYFQFDPSTDKRADSKSRASYVIPSDYYSIVGMEADKNAAGETLDGQWVVTVATHGEGNFRNVSDLYLVVNYTDAAGTVRKVSSPALPVQIIPTADEGLEFHYSLVQNFRKADGNPNPYILQVDINAYRNDAGEVWYYDRGYVTPSVVSVDGVLSADFSTLYDKHYISFTPNEENELWTKLETEEVKKVTTEAEIVMTDFGGMKKHLKLPVTYCPRTIVLHREIPISELNANRDNDDYFIDFSADVAEYGLTTDMNSCLTRISALPEWEGWNNWNVVIDILETAGKDNTFVLHIIPFIPKELTAGFTMTLEDATKVRYVLSSFPQGKENDIRELLDVDIRIMIDGIQ